MSTRPAPKAPSAPFETKQYDVTDPTCQALLIVTFPFHYLPFCPGIIGRKTLILEEEEVYFEVRGGICDITTRRPYGELQSVDKVNVLCCTGVSSSLFRGMVLCPGSGCNHDVVAELVDEMKRRMKERGDTGQIRRTEDTLIEIRALKSDMEEIKSDLRAIMKSLNVAPTSRQPDSLSFQTEMDRGDSIA